jgi:hypothetical protein
MESCCICQPAAFWRADLWSRLGGFDEQVEYAMDYEYWIRADRAGAAIEHLPVKLAASRVHSGTKTLTARPAIFREIFDVTRRRGGYVSEHYVDGFWHHLAYERRSATAALRLFPRTRSTLARTHAQWLNRHLATRSQLARNVARTLRREVIENVRSAPQLSRAGRAASRRLASGVPLPRAGRVLLRAANGGTAVRGLWLDNWASDRLDVIVEARTSPRTYRLVGIPVAAMTAGVSIGARTVASVALEAGREETIEITLEAGKWTTVSIAFSEHLTEPSGRRVSFLLQETDLFREGDLARWG